MIAVKNIIVQQEGLGQYLKQVFLHDPEEIYPYSIGRLKTLILPNAKLCYEETVHNAE